jgi:predicted CXXCH cytochrome family protein
MHARRKRPLRKPSIWMRLRSFFPSLTTSRYWPVSGIILGVLVLSGAGSMVVGASLEEKDSFCASCHSQPETTYYLRTLEGTMVDLASAHKTKEVKCIDCHSGVGLIGRFEAFFVGGGDLIHWVTRTAIQPAPLIYPISDRNCLKCHGATENTQDFSRHFHAFLPRWQAIDKNAARCVDCHSSHTTDGDPSLGFLNQARATQVCTRCHQMVGSG